MSNFKNSKGTLNKSTKRTSEKSPEYYGSLTIDEELARYIVGKIKAGDDLVKLDLSAWLRSSASGKFISIAISTPYVKAGAAPAKRKTIEFEDEVPF